MKRQITSMDIYRHYLGDIIVGPLYNSPLIGREGDDTPSFGLYIKDDQLLWKDFGLSNPVGNKPANMVQHLFDDIPLSSAGYYQAVAKIKKEVGSSDLLSAPLSQLRRNVSTSNAYVRGRNRMHDYEYSYWKRFGIEYGDLSRESIEPLEFFSWQGDTGEPNIQSTPDDPAFIYWWGKSPASWKLYRPLVKNKKNKFRQNCVDDVIEGWNTLISDYKVNHVKFDAIIKLSSTKDRLVVRKCLEMFPVDDKVFGFVNGRSETDYEIFVDRKDQIMSMCKRFICADDGDEPGYEASAMLSSLMGGEYADFRGKLGDWKDFADFVDTERGSNTMKDLRTILVEELSL